MAWFRNYYRHEACDVSWTDEWSCACNDRCPKCHAEIEPEGSEKIGSDGDEGLEVSESHDQCLGALLTHIAGSPQIVGSQTI